MKLFYKCIRHSVKSIFSVLYRHKIYGQEYLPQGRALIAPNHASFYDPPIIAISCPEEIAFLARKSLFSKTLGPFIRKLNAYPVTGTPQDLNSFKLVCWLLNENKKVVIFPEGLRTHTGELGQIKAGIGMLAMRCHSPIIPAYIHGTYNVWNRKRSFPKIFGKTACVFGSPILWENFNHLGKKESQEAIAEHLKNAIQNLKKWYDNGATGMPP
jgi:1-acyl-sn-glycerol-3-phosphate acyltransferase